MANDVYYYGGLAVKGTRTPIEVKEVKIFCCNNLLDSNYCPTCGSKGKETTHEIIRYDLIENEISDSLKEDLYDEFHETFQVIYPEGGVSGLAKGEFILIPAGLTMDKHDDSRIVVFNSDHVAKFRTSLAKWNHFFTFKKYNLSDLFYISAKWGQW